MRGVGKIRTIAKILPCWFPEEVLWEPEILIPNSQRGSVHTPESFVVGGLCGLAVCGKVQADVLGLASANTSGPYSSSEYANLGNFLTVNFSTNTNSSLNSFKSVKFLNLGSMSTSGGSISSLNIQAILRLGAFTATDNIVYTTPNAAINLTNIGNTNWAASSNYTLEFNINQGTAVTLDQRYISDNGVVTNSLPDWISSSSQFSGTSDSVGSFGVAFSLYSAVPEPTTMILTGSALAAGAIGAYFKRRRKTPTEIAS